MRYKSKIALLIAVNIAINLLIDRCLRTMTMVGRWTGGGLVLWCTRWCVADYHSIIVIMTFCLNLSCFNKSNFLGLCRRTLPLSYQACWSRTPNKGLSLSKTYSWDVWGTDCVVPVSVWLKGQSDLFVRESQCVWQKYRKSSMYTGLP